MFQVLYENLDAMQIADMTSWSIDVTADVKDIPVYDDDGEPTGETTDEYVEGNTLTGILDTYATLNSVSKSAYTSSSSSYTPELYTKSQVNSYISNTLGEPYASDFDDYIYIVWRISISGTATQAYQITIDDSTFGDTTGMGEVVGYKIYTSTSGLSSSITNSSYDEATGTYTAPTLTLSSSTARSFSATFYVVTAYDADLYETDSALENDVTVTLHPIDSYDDDTVKSASAQTTWGEYFWQYSGNIIGVSKTKDETYNAYLTLYDLNKDDGLDTGSFPYTVKSTDRSYALTHYTYNDDGEMYGNTGEWIEGAYCTTTTVDDALYLYPNGGTTPSYMLTKDDYYFSSVKITNTSSDFDIWEDKTASATTYDGVDQNLYVYAMFYYADESAMDENGWEYVGMVNWTSSGTMTYTFTSDELARQPYRVMAVHSDANYVTYCTIDLSVTLRADSPAMAKAYAYCEEAGISLDSVKIENLGGVAGQTYNVPGYTDGGYFQDTSTASPNYSEKDTETGETLAEFTEDLYGTILMRDNAYKTLTRLSETSGVSKNVSTENDVANARVLANYTITGYEAYYVTGSSTVNSFKNVGMSLPDRYEIVICDLLPYGMQFNANSTVTAGRITSMNSSGTWKTNPNAWNTTNVSVEVTDDDVITNWNGTGRTMIYFHIYYTGDDASAFYDVPSSNADLWFQGFGIAFQAYYAWTDMDAVDSEYNIAAYTVSYDQNGEVTDLLGSGQYDDGTYSDGSHDYDPFDVPDLNEDGVTDVKSNMYAKATTATNVATSSSDFIKKLVRADDDIVAEYGTTTVVSTDSGYTYQITLTNGSGAILSDICIFDRLEYSVEDGRVETENQQNPDSVFNGVTDEDIQNHWTGTFNGLSLSALTDAGAEPVVYYNESRNAIISEDEYTDDTGTEHPQTTPADVLTEENGWIEASVYEAAHTTVDEDGNVTVDLSGVKAVAVDIPGFELAEGESISFQIHMISPDTESYYEGSDGEEHEVRYAFNNPSYYSVSTDITGDETSATDHGDTVRVELGEAGTLSIEKEFKNADTIPDGMTSTRFTFEVTRNGEILANQDYMLYTWDTDTEEWVSTGVVQATDINGQFTLRAGQKAVFSRLTDVENVEVKELEDIFWTSDVETEANGSNELTYTFNNSYRSPVYLYKTTATTDLATQEELDDAEFTFRIMVDTDGNGTYDTPYADGEYIYVKSVLTDGSSPAIDTSKGDGGYGQTDENGEVTLGIGDIIVFFPSDADGVYVGTKFEVTEVESGESWICDNSTATGTTSGYGVAVTITNNYKYRNLILTKELTNYDQDESLCEDEWTFRVTDADGNPVTGNHWYMIDADGNPVEGIEGYLDDNGEFSFTGAGQGRRIVIEKLVMDETYTITETDWDEELYETVNDGTTTVTEPIYSTSKSASVTNRFLPVDLEVRKIALTSDTTIDVGNYKFTFILKDADGEPVVGAEYTISGGDGTVYTTDSEGKFTIGGGQTAVFDDIGYEGDIFIVEEVQDDNFPQIYPQDEGDAEAKLTNDGGEVMFINGSFDDIMSIEKDIVGLDEVGQNYVDYVKSHYGTDSGLVSGEYYVSVDIGVYDGDDLVTDATGALIDYTDSNTDYPFVYIKISPDGSYELKSYNGGLLTGDNAVTLHVGETVYIAEINGYTVKAQETGGIIDGFYQVASDIQEDVGSDYILVEDDVTSGSAQSDGSITLVNNISSGHQESAIYKLMTTDDNGNILGYEVPTGSKIVFRVERYDASADTWYPASGIKYIAMDGYTGERGSTELSNTSGVLTTGSDGKITLTKTDNGYPWIRFIEDEVYANVYTDMENGQLRIVELLDESDDAWGRLVGYDLDGWVNTPALTVPYADTFYDGNDDLYMFDIVKISSSETAQEGDKFTYTLWQVISATTSPIESMDQIQDSIVGDNLYYIVYDLETNEYISEGYTDGNGQFTLEVGQYARFYVPTGTVWYFYEGVTPGYILQEVTDNEATDSGVIDDTIGVIGEETDAKEAKVNYAVRLYGICADEYSYDGGKTTGTASLTFGAALGTNYINSYKAHLNESEYNPDNGQYCIHWMSWDEITELANGKTETQLKEIFGDCLDNGCTKSIELKANSTLFNQTTVVNAMNQNYQGDGVSTLYYLLNGTGSSSYTYGACWNYSYTDSSSSDPANIYSRSRIRATLIGDNTDAKSQVDSGKKDYYGVDTMCDETNCLFSCFPTELQNAIVPRTTLNTGNATSGTSASDKTTYDKLWLPSLKELGITNIYDDSGGNDYGIFTSNNDRCAYEYSGTGGTSSTALSYWSRSRYSRNYYYAYDVTLAGTYGNNVYVSYANGLSPAFCIGEAVPSTVKYAVSIYDICADDAVNANGESGRAALTFGPATGASYIDSYRECDSETCIHKLSWDEIIELCDEYANNETKLRELFESCLENGCTTSVELDLNDTIANSDADWAEYAEWIGDGTSVLYDSIYSEYRRWNGSYSSYTAGGGWPASKVRANLNGKDEYTNTSQGGSSYILDSNLCLFSCFPESLQSNIVAKAVKSDTVNASQDSNNVMTTYDKLWLFSEHELGGTNRNMGNEGILYNRINYYDKIGYSSLSNIRIGYYESGLICQWILRSINIQYSGRIYDINTSGDVGWCYANNTYSIAPGFCIGFAPYTAFATYSEDDYSLNFYYDVAVPSVGDEYDGYTVTEVYTGFDSTRYTKSGNVPWYNNRANIKTIQFNESFRKCQPTAMAFWFFGCANLTQIIGGENIDTSNVTTLLGTFYNCSSLENVNELASWDTSNVTTMGEVDMANWSNYGTFAGCSSLKDISGLKDWNVSNVNTFEYTFYKCSSLQNVNDLNKWNTSSAISLISMFSNCTALENVDGLSNWNIANVTYLGYKTNNYDRYGTFNLCSSLKDIQGLTNWDTSNVISLESLFSNCSSLESIEPLYSWKTSAVTSLAYTFYNCSSLENVDGLYNWDTSSVTSLYETFGACSSLKDINGLANWKTQNITTLYETFYKCNNLENIDGLANWDTSKVTSLGYTFYNCSALTVVDSLANWDTSSLTSLYATFWYCYGLTSIDVSNWNTAKVTSMYRTFYDCRNLETIYSNDEMFVTSAVSDGSRMFSGCTKLVGGNGTTYSSSEQSYTMAHIDTAENPGYFTDVADKPS